MATLAAAGEVDFSANAGNHRLFIIANADATAAAGVYFVEVRGVVSQQSIYRRVQPVGRVTELGGSMLTAGNHSLTVTDLALPTPLTTLKLAVTSQGQMKARLDAPGTVDFMAASAGHELFAAAVPGGGASGSYAVDLSGRGGPALTFVNTASDGASVGASTFTGLVNTAGSYRLRLTDFSFPQGFTALRAVVTQNGVPRGSADVPGTADVTLVAGTVSVLVFGQANTAGNGIFGVELRPMTGTGPAVIEGTHGVGTAFGAWQFSVNHRRPLPGHRRRSGISGALRGSRRGHHARSRCHRQLLRRRLVHFLGNAGKLLHHFHRAPGCAERRRRYVSCTRRHGTRLADGHADRGSGARVDRWNDPPAMVVDQCHAMHGVGRLVGYQGPGRQREHACAQQSVHVQSRVRRARWQQQIATGRERECAECRRWRWWWWKTG